jgi:hypothetical protein
LAVEYVINTGHEIQFEKTHRLIPTATCVDQIVKEATEMRLHPRNFYREAGFVLSQTWQPISY